MTIKKIAEMAGVSIGTVDRVLNNRGHVKPEVERRIREIIEATGYQTNKVAKSLSIRNRKLKIGVLLHASNNEFTDSIMEGILEGANEVADSGISVIIKKTLDFDAESQLAELDSLLNEQISALIIIPISDPRISERLQTLAQSGFPLILLNGQLDNCNYLAYIGRDQSHTARLAANMVYLLGNKRGNVLLITPSLKIQSHRWMVDVFCSCIQTRYQDVHVSKILEISNNDFEVYQDVKRELQVERNVDTILYFSSVSAGGLQAISESDPDQKIRVIALNNSKRILEGIKKRQISASIAIDSKEMGKQSIMTAFQYFTKSRVCSKNNILIRSKLIIFEDLL